MTVDAEPHGGAPAVPSEDPAQAGVPSNRTFGTFAVLAAIAVLIGMAGLCSGGRAVRRIPEAQRAAVLSHTVGELQQFCGEGRTDALKDHCRELAAFAAQFDECTDECVTLVRRELTPSPTR